MIGKYSDQMTFEYILGRMLDRVPDTVDKREGSVIYDALAPAAAELAKTYMELDVVMGETFVDTASLQYLILRCKERGIEAQGETAAIIQGTFTPAELELSAGTRFNCDDVNYAFFAITEQNAVFESNYYYFQDFYRAVTGGRSCLATRGAVLAGRLLVPLSAYG